jgi:hypothetical protein
MLDCSRRLHRFLQIKFRQNLQPLVELKICGEDFIHHNLKLIVTSVEF